MLRRRSNKRRIRSMLSSKSKKLRRRKSRIKTTKRI
jgi:hypothetical protein